MRVSPRTGGTGINEIVIASSVRDAVAMARPRASSRWASHHSIAAGAPDADPILAFVSARRTIRQHAAGRHREHLRARRDVGERGRIGAGHPDLRAEPLEVVVERGAAPRIEMGADLPAK